MDPVDTLLDDRQALDDAAAVGQNAGADRVDHALEGAAVVGHDGDSGRNAGPHVLQVGFAEVRHHVPVVVIQQGKDRLKGGGVLADRRFQRYHHAVKGRADFGKFEMQLGQRNLREDPRPLRHHGINAGHGGGSLFRLQQGGLQFGARRFFGRSRLIKIFL